jgi:hypothetical protein
MRRGFKVVDKKLGSITRGRKGPGHVQYSVVELVGPPRGCGPLCVLKDLETANKFKDWVETEEGVIYECIYMPSNLDYVWVGRGGRKSFMEDLFPGTVLADKVRLTEEVNWERGEPDSSE